jgi:hypothetical protein
MKLDAIKGELAFAALFAAVGLYWVAGSFDFAIWSGFAPDSGFLPLVFGLLLLALSVGVIVMLLTTPVDETVEREPLAKPLKILGALILAVASLGFIGFAIPLFLMMLFMFAYVEKLPLIRSLVVSAVVSGIFLLVFARWLQVPVPVFPWSY